MRRTAGLALAAALAGCVAPGARPPVAEVERPPVPANETPAIRRPLASLIADDPALSRFRALAAAGGLARTIAGRGPVTVLAPTDAAFGRLPAGTVEALLQPGNRPSLRHLLRFWIVPGAMPPADLAARVQAGATRLSTLDGEAVSAMAGPQAPMLADAAGRRGAVTGGAAASDGALIELDGILGPRSIEPGRGGPGSAPPPFRSP